MLGVTILGNNSAIPAFDRHPTAQILNLSDQLYLIDCGEGTQMQLAKYKIRRSRINRIFISHLHGDHYFGFAGLLTSMGLLGREAPLHVHAPKALKEIIDLQLKVADTIIPFPFHFHALEEEGVIVDEKRIEVKCFKVQHRIECWGFLFQQKKHPRKILIDKVKQYDIPVSFYNQLHWGEDYTLPNGTIIKNEELTTEASKPKAYAFAADTIYDEALVEKFYGVDLLYHEATYLDALRERAASRFHTTAKQAAQLAKLAHVKKLIIGHFSSKYETLDEFYFEAKNVFHNTELAIEGVSYRI